MPVDVGSCPAPHSMHASAATARVRCYTQEAHDVPHAWATHQVDRKTMTLHRAYQPASCLIGLRMAGSDKVVSTPFCQPNDASYPYSEGGGGGELLEDEWPELGWEPSVDGSTDHARVETSLMASRGSPDGQDA